MTSNLVGNWQVVSILVACLYQKIKIIVYVINNCIKVIL